MTIRVETRLRDDVALDSGPIVNQAVLNNGQDIATAELSTASQLPNTGETPWWRLLVVLLVGATVALVTAFGVYRPRTERR